MTTLDHGAKGEEVKELQAALKEQGFFKGGGARPGVDGFRQVMCAREGPGEGRLHPHPRRRLCHGDVPERKREGSIHRHRAHRLCTQGPGVTRQCLVYAERESLTVSLARLESGDMAQGYAVVGECLINDQSIDRKVTA